MELNYLSILKLQWLDHWSLGMDIKFHPTLYNGCNNLSMMRLKWVHFSKMGAQWYTLKQIASMEYVTLTTIIIFCFN